MLVSTGVARRTVGESVARPPRIQTHTRRGRRPCCGAYPPARARGARAHAPVRAARSPLRAARALRALRCAGGAETARPLSLSVWRSGMDGRAWGQRRMSGVRGRRWGTWRAGGGWGRLGWCRWWRRTYSRGPSRLEGVGGHRAVEGRRDPSGNYQDEHCWAVMNGGRNDSQRGQTYPAYSPQRSHCS